MSFAGTIFFLVIIFIIILINYKQKQKTNALLENQNREILSQQQIIQTTNLNLTNSINYAKRIQQAMLPPIDELSKYLPDSFVLFKPRDIVSGDFYWFSQTRLKSAIAKSKDSVINKLIYGSSAGLSNSIIISAIDCTGHGVPGAFMSMIGFNLIHEIISKGIIEPQKILSVLNTGIRNQLKQNETDNHDGMDMALCVINQDNNLLEFAGAKNPLVYVKNNELFQIQGDFVPIGGFYRENDKRNYTKHVIKIDAPTMFYIFSDGFSDQIGGPNGKKFLSKRFRELLFNIHDKPMQQQREILEQKLEEWIGEKYGQVDDILVIGFKLNPNNDT